MPWWPDPHRLPAPSPPPTKGKPTITQETGNRGVGRA